MKIKRRPSKNKTSAFSGDCTRNQRNIIYEAIKARLPLARAAMLAGVKKPTFDRWMRYGIDKNKPRRYYFFRRKVLELRAENEKQSLAVISKMANGGTKLKEMRISIGGKFGREITKTTKEMAPQWQAAAWLLERTLPDDYGLKKRDDNKNKEASEIAKEIQEAMKAMDETIPEEINDEE
jgi:hypothetical protein